MMKILSTYNKAFFFALFFGIVCNAFATDKSKADALYAKENYTEAIKIYESILKEGVSSEIYYNLGNCYYKLDDMPRAILNYERAYKLSPGDKDVRFNLALSRGKITDKVVPPSEMFFVTWWHNITNMISADAWGVAAFMAFVLLLAGVCAYMFISSITIRKIGAYGAMACFVVCLFCNLAAVSQNSNFRSKSYAIVMTPAVTVKSSPSNTSTDLFIIHEGSKVTVIDSSMKEWVEVLFEEGKEGWVRVSDVEII